MINKVEKQVNGYRIALDKKVANPAVVSKLVEK